MPERTEKPWGYELLWAQSDRYLGKLLVIEPGARLSLQKHLRKDETIYVLEGRLRLHLEDSTGKVQIEELAPGQHRRIPPGHLHRFEATTQRVQLIEVSTPEQDDIIRIEDDYGRTDGGG